MNKRRSNEFGRHEFMVNFLRLADLAVFGGFEVIWHVLRLCLLRNKSDLVKQFSHFGDNFGPPKQARTSDLRGNR